MLFIFLIFLLAYLILFIYLKRGLNQGLSSIKSEFPESNDLPFISVVCPYRNEVDNLKSFIESISIQDYQSDLFELIMINDHSTDNSEVLLKDICSKSSIKVKLISLPHGIESKKNALVTGIRESIGKIIVTTDADTQRDKGWLTSISKFFSRYNADMMIGPVSITNSQSLFNRLQRIEFLSLQVVTIGFAGNDNPILCNAANLSFSRNSFESIGGYSGQKSTSGDDFFLMAKMKKAGMKILLNPDFESKVFTRPLESPGELLSQRIRWAGKTKFTKDKSIILTGIFNVLLSFLLILLPFIEIYRHNYPTYSLCLWSIKFACDLYLLQKAGSAFKTTFKLNDFIAVFIIYPFYICCTFILSLIIRPNWKGRQIQ